MSNPPVFVGSPSRTLFGGCSRPACHCCCRCRDRMDQVGRRARRMPTRNADPIVAGSRVQFAAGRPYRSCSPCQQCISEGNRRGNTGGEQGHRARCSPSRAPSTIHVFVAGNAAGDSHLRGNFNQRCELLNKSIGRRSVPPDKGDAVDVAVNRIPWRERPRDSAAWPAKRAATQVVAHATLSLPQPELVVVARVRPGGIDGVGSAS